MAKQQRNSSSTRQETQLKNNYLRVIAGILLLALIIFGTLNLQEDTPPQESPQSNIQSREAAPNLATDNSAVQNREVPDSDVITEENFNEESTQLEEEAQTVKESNSVVSQKNLVKRQKASPKQTQSKASVTSAVQWAGMAATIEGSEAVIRWKTLNEANTAYFEIERSIDEVKFDRIGTLDGKALPYIDAEEYIFSDSSLRFVGMPRIYYRINQVGLDNKVHSSEIFEYDLGLDLDLYIKVEEIKDGILTVAYAGDEAGKANVGVLTPSGKVVYEEEVEVELTPKRRNLNASIWGEGVYLLVLYDESTRVTEMLEISH